MKTSIPFAEYEANIEEAWRVLLCQPVWRSVIEHLEAHGTPREALKQFFVSGFNFGSEWQEQRDDELIEALAEAAASPDVGETTE